MHYYKNGREAKNGDKVMVFPVRGMPYVGVIYDFWFAGMACHGKVAIISPADPVVDLQEVLHLDDVKERIAVTPPRDGGGLKLEAVPNSSKPESGPV